MCPLMINDHKLDCTALDAVRRASRTVRAPTLACDIRVQGHVRWSTRAVVAVVRLLRVVPSSQDPPPAPLPPLLHLLP